MLDNIADFSVERSVKQAIIFYFFWFAMVLILSVSLVVFISGQGSELTHEEGVRVGSVVAIIGSIGISFAVLHQKKLLQLKYLLWVLFAGILSIFGGGLLGLLPAAYLSTLKKNE